MKRAPTLGIFPLLFFFMLGSCTRELADFSYYKNLPELSGTTRDAPPLFFIVKVELGYEWGDKKTQLSLSELKAVIADSLRNLFRSKSAADYDILVEEELKQDILETVNTQIHRYDKFRDVKGVQVAAIVKKQVFKFR